MLKLVVILAGLLNFFISINSNVISTTTGNVRGNEINVIGKEIDEYLAIPYAEPPLGELRFKPPVPVNPWDEVYNATQNPPSCMQIFCSDECSEDCLFLNIWVPKNSSNSACMVWFYGGAFIAGSINNDYANGSIISAMGGVIFAAINYRLGPFGFLFSETDDARGNMGMKDQLLGLRWIKDNIRNFGGDPNKITIFGLSAGAMSVSTLLVSPLSVGLFNSAIMQSGSAYHPSMIVHSTSVAKLRSTKLAVRIGCTTEGQDIANDSNVMSCMREQNASSIVAAEEEITLNMLTGEENPQLSIYSPIYGDDYLPNHPIEEMASGSIHVRSVMIGTVLDEGSVFLFGINLYGQQFNLTSITKESAAILIRQMFRGLENIPPENVVEYYLKNINSSDISMLLKGAYDSVGDWLFTCPSVFLSESSSVNGKYVYHYSFSHSTNDTKKEEWMGVIHGADLEFIFGFPFINESLYTFEEREFSGQLIGAWTSFAKEEKPVYTKLPGEWPRYTNSSRLAVDLNPYNVSYTDPYKDACRFWKDYF